METHIRLNGAVEMTASWSYWMGELHALNDESSTGSSAHWNEAPRGVDEKVNCALVLDVGLGGPESRFTSTGGAGGAGVSIVHV